jgi:hypothetical protein
MSHTKPIDLGRSLGESIGPALQINKKQYPHLHLDELEDSRLADLPNEGSAEIHYKIVDRTHRESDNGGKKKRRTCSLVLEITSIEPGHDPKFNGGKNNWMDDARKSFKTNFK